MERLQTHHPVCSLLTRISVFWVVVFILIGTSAGKNCESCGGLAVPYPLSTSPGCGDPDYSVFCNATSGVLNMRSMSGSYYPIRTIDSPSNTFVIQTARFVGNTCRTSDIVSNGIHLSKDGPFNFTDANTVFLLNCSSLMLGGSLNCSEASPCRNYLKQSPVESASCRTSPICCTIDVGGPISSYGIRANETRCTGYKSFINLDVNSPFATWTEGLQVLWRSPPELRCQNQTECLDSIPNSSCRIDTARSGTMRCYCDANFQWDPFTGTCTDIPCDWSWRCHRSKYIALIAGLTFSILVLSMVAGFLLYKRHMLRMEAKARIKKEREDILAAHSGGRSSKLFSGKEMKKCTGNFCKDFLLGSGGFGDVYKGFLEDGTEVAVKIGKVGSTKGTEQVLNEVSILSQVNHRSLVRIMGCCVELEQPLLIYEFVPNGTLYDHIHTSKYSFLDWNQRLRIAHQAAEGLAYLHSSAVSPIYHRDVKSSNILLDYKCNAKVADFGLSRLVEPDMTHVSTCVQGTIGYLDPEYYRTYQLTDKSDVYSFGVVLLELLTCKGVIDYGRGSNDANLVMFVRNKMELETLVDDAVDKGLTSGASKESVEAMKALCSLAMHCVEERRQDRPSMKEVVEEIEYIISIEETAAMFASRKG